MKQWGFMMATDAYLLSHSKQTQTADSIESSSANHYPRFGIMLLRPLRPLFSQGEWKWAPAFMKD
jgi:hypothetical protein